MKFTIALTFLMVLSGWSYAQKGSAGISIVSPTISLGTTITDIHSPSRLCRTMDTYFSNVYTHNTIILFSYYDGTQFLVQDAFGGTVYSGILNRSEHVFLSPGYGFYSVAADQKYSVLIGDPFSDGTCGYFAVDQNGSGVSCTLFTVCPDSEIWASYNRPKNIVFAYENNTNVEVQELGGPFFWSGTLNAGEHQEWTGELALKYLAVCADKRVSFQHYNDCGFFVPGANYKWADTLFYAYSGGSTGYSWTDQVWWMIIGLTDNTLATLSNTAGDTVFNGIINRGEVVFYESGTVYPALYQKYLILHSNREVLFCSSPMDGAYAHLIFAPATDGSSGGTEFYTPACSGSRIIVFGRENGTQVSVEDPTGGTLFYTIDSGEYLDYGCSYGAGIYYITSDSTVIVIEFSSTAAGSEFTPVYFNIVPPCSLEVVASADDTLLCHNGTTLHATVDGASGPVTFEWWSNPPGFSSNSQNPIIGPISIGTWFYVQATDTMPCEDVDSVFILDTCSCTRAVTWIECPFPCYQFTSCPNQVIIYGIQDTTGVSIDTTRVWVTIIANHQFGGSDTTHISGISPYLNFSALSDSIFATISGNWLDGDYIIVILDSLYNINNCRTIPY